MESNNEIDELETKLKALKKEKDERLKKRKIRKQIKELEKEKTLLHKLINLGKNSR